MAVKRVNLMDAIDGRASLISRSRTAICRRGTVTVGRDANGLARVQLGGAEIEAVSFITPRPGDEVLVISDTDGYWIVGAHTQAQVTGTDLFTVSANFTVNSVFGLRQGKFVLLQLNLRSVNAVTSDAGGNFADIAAGTVVPTDFRPTSSMNAYGTTSAAMGNYSITSGGAVSLTHFSAPNITVPANTSWGIQFVYLGA